MFDALKTALPDNKLQQEALINGFPVDIVIDGKICIEVDGPQHFAWIEDDAKAASGQYKRVYRTKDRFIDHMLEQYGFQIFRISYAESDENLDRFIQKIQRLLPARQPVKRPYDNSQTPVYTRPPEKKAKPAYDRA